MYNLSVGIFASFFETKDVQGTCTCNISSMYTCTVHASSMYTCILYWVQLNEYANMYIVSIKIWKMHDILY
jgi:hypothetical protein